MQAGLGAYRIDERTRAFLDEQHGLLIGGYKQSGWGRELGREGVELYTELKSVAIALKKAGDWLQLKG